MSTTSAPAAGNKPEREYYDKPITKGNLTAWTELVGANKDMVKGTIAIRGERKDDPTQFVTCFCTSKAWKGALTPNELLDLYEDRPVSIEFESNGKPGLLCRSADGFHKEPYKNDPTKFNLALPTKIASYATGPRMKNVKDENGNTIRDENGNLVKEPVLDDAGNPIRDIFRYRIDKCDYNATYKSGTGSSTVYVRASLRDIMRLANGEVVTIKQREGEFKLKVDTVTPKADFPQFNVATVSCTKVGEALDQAQREVANADEAPEPITHKP